MTQTLSLNEVSPARLPRQYRPGDAARALSTDDQRWVDGLAGRGSQRERTCRELYVILLRSAKFEIRHRSGASRLGGADLDDIACQAASDALLSIMRKVREFRGDSKFTTWAARFVVFEVKAKLRQHAATHTTLPLLPEHDDAGLAEADSSPDLQAEARDLANAALIVINTQFSTHQRTVFLTLLACDLSAAVVGVRMGLNANSVYQTVFRARQCLRSRLLAQGFLA